MGSPRAAFGVTAPGGDARGPAQPDPRHLWTQARAPGHASALRGSTVRLARAFTVLSRTSPRQAETSRRHPALAALHNLPRIERSFFLTKNVTVNAPLKHCLTQRRSFHDR